jgi:predicted DsbA family dithiol-disulfide isomerase
LALHFDAIEKQPNTLAAHALIELAQTTNASEARDECRIADRVVEALFKAYFVDGKFIGNIDVLIEIAERCGMDGANVRATLNDAFALDRVANADANVRAQGVNGVPFFVFNQKLALSGAQPPETMFDAMIQSMRE